MTHAASWRILWRVGSRYLLGRPWQTGLMVLGIVLGVAVGVAVDLANVSAGRAFVLSTEALVGRATHVITAGPAGIEESVFTRLRLKLPYLPASPAVTAAVSSPRLGGGPLQLLGIDPLSAAPFRDFPDNGPRGDRLGEFMTRPGAVFLPQNLAARYGMAMGSALTITAQGVERTVSVAGLLDAPGTDSRAADGLLLADIATAQELLDRPGRLDRIDLVVPEGDQAVLDGVHALLPEGSRVQPAEARSDAVLQMTAAFRTNLTALSLLALVVGMFLIFNTMTFSVVKRRPLFGALRSLGVTRAEVFMLVMMEAALVGFIGSILGLALGVLLAQGAVRAVSQTINDLYFATTVTALVLPIESGVKAILLGVGATLLSALPAAWEATTSPPTAVLQRSALEGRSLRLSGRLAWTGWGMLALGAAVLASPTADLTVSFLGTFIVVVGFALLAPAVTLRFARAAEAPLGRVAGPVGRLAARGVVSSISRTVVAVAALTIAVAVTIGVSLMIGSFRETVIAWLEQTLRGDVYITTVGQPTTQTADPLRAEALKIVKNWPGVRRVDTLRAVTVDSPRGPIHITAVENPDFGRERLYLWQAGGDVWKQMLGGAVAISEPLANRLQVHPGAARIELFSDSGPRAFPVVAVYYDYTSSEGSVSMADSVYRRHWDDHALTALGLRLGEGADVEETARALGQRLNPVQLLAVRPNAALRRDALVVFDRTFAITAALQFLAMLVAFVGVVSALLSVQLDRQREVGVLRALGLTGRQLWGLMFLETGLIGTISGLLAMPAGLALSLILIYIINKRSFGWTLQLDLAVLPFAEALLIALVAALLAGIYPAQRMGEAEPIEALRFE